MADDEAIRSEAIRHGVEAYLVKGDASGGMIMQAIRQAIERQPQQKVREN